MNSSYGKMLEYVGDADQLMTVRDAAMKGGFQEGVRMLDVSNGGNLTVTVLPDRCMDIYQVRYKGKNMNYLAPCGIVAPQYYDAQGDRWLRGFYVGMLTTCGLQHIGGPYVNAAGEELGLHGRMANTPAENVSWKRDVQDGVPTLTVEGTMREARIFGENLTLHRQIKFVYETDSIVLSDTITNHGFGDRPFMYALHLNYGYPLLEEGTKIMIDALETKPRTEEAAKYLDTWSEVEAPQYPYPERCYFHTIRKDAEGMAQYTIFNEKRGIGVNVCFNGNDLPEFTQWKMLGKGEYVMGLEPMNYNLDAPKPGDEGCTCPVLKPHESRTYVTTLQFIDSI